MRAPNTFFISAVSILILSGCTTTSNHPNPVNSSAQSPERLPASQVDYTPYGKWQLLAMPGYNKPSYEHVYRHFSLNIENSSINGFAVNHFSAATSWGKNNISVANNLISTRKMVRGTKGQLEKIYLHRLATATQWNVNNQNLILAGKHGKLIFQRIK